MELGRIICVVLLLFFCVSAMPANSDDLSFESRRWTQADGAPGQPDDLTQASNGLLWFASPTGLYSFDGVTFRRETEVYGQPLISSNTLSVLALPNGDLAVGYKFGGISLFSQNGVRHFRPGKDFPPGSVFQITSDLNGDLYACTSSAIVALKGGQWQVLGQRSLPAGMPNLIAMDQSATLWVKMQSDLFMFDKATDKFVLIAKVNPFSYISVATGVIRVKLADGRFAQVRGPGQIEILPISESARYLSVVSGPGGTMLGGRDGGLAKLVQDKHGVWKESEFYPRLYGGQSPAANDNPFRVLIDREGNVWSGTVEGIQRLRLHRFHHFKSLDSQWFVQQGIGGDMWLGGANKRMRSLNPQGTLQTTNLMSPNALLHTGPGHAWLGTETELWEFDKDTRRRWDLPATMRRQYGIQALAQDSGGTLLVSIVRNGLWRFQHGNWSPDQRVKHLKDPTPISMLTDASGRTWLGFTDSRLGLLSADGVDLVSERLNLRIGNVLSMLEVDGRLLIGGDAGLAWVTPDSVHLMRLRSGRELLRVTGILRDHSGALWLHGNEGLYLLHTKALEEFWRAPETILDTELFNFEDGVRGVAAPTRPLPSLALDPAGRLYYATVLQIGWVDPQKIRRNTRPPDVLIRSLATPDKHYRPVNRTVLPELTTAVDISFTAPSLSIPERVRIKYRLDGVDKEWREIQQERTAHYTNLAPGKYRFHVIAANEDGVWNLEGAELLFSIAPAFWQTVWFRAGCVLLLLLATWQFYRWRVAIVKVRAVKSAEGEWNATLLERGRIARSLHDNLLQAVQALMMQFHLLQSRLTREPELQQKIESVLNYAEQLVKDTRDEVMGLRNEHLDDDWTCELRCAIAGMAPDIAEKLEFTVEGDARQVTAQAIEEISSVVREAVLNCAQHAQASQIRVQLTVGVTHLIGEISDDGIGIDEDAAGHGKAGHFGIVGMRERLHRLGGEIRITRLTQGGTAVRFSVPAQQVYSHSREKP
jgi:signal transduction histidine kinase/ligand-binding sensor domain-containing protein